MCFAVNCEEYGGQKEAAVAGFEGQRLTRPRGFEGRSRVYFYFLFFMRSLDGQFRIITH